MSIQSPESFTVHEELSSGECFTTYRATHRPTSTVVRLTKMSSDLSASDAFRAAFRTDAANLRVQEHVSVLRLLFWGEECGALFYATEFPDGDSAQSRLDEGLAISWDEFVDIGWQLASAVQHGHNLGLTHGGLSPASVVISDTLRVKVADFGLHRWIAIGTSTVAEPEKFEQQTRRDLMDLGTLLKALQLSVSSESSSATSQSQLVEMQTLLNTLASPPTDFTARDLQGRLGDMLLAGEGESIDMIDHRKGQGLSRRSLVDELFDEVEFESPKSATVRSESKPEISWRVVLLIVLAALTCIYLAWRS